MATRIASNSSHFSSISLRAALFHSTPVSERRRRTYWNSGSYGDSSKRHNNHAKRYRGMETKRLLFRDINAYADYLFESWKDAGGHDNDSESNRWFKIQYGINGAQRNGNGFGGSRRSFSGKNGFQFCYSDGEQVETIFHSAFGDGYCSWSNSAKNSNWRNSSDYFNYRGSWNWRYTVDDDDTTDEDDTSTESVSSDRRTLGLSASGPLKLEDVKNAYRACALRWHPDRHQGPSKVEAEERFKHCSAAYQKLCNDLAACSV